MAAEQSLDRKWPCLGLPANLEVPTQWEALLAEIETGWRRVIIIGATDTGKSTLSQWLAQQLSSQGRVAMLDADVGQSRIGPPATVGWRFAEAKQGEFYFVGDVTPAACPADCVAGTVRLVQRAERAGADYVIVDTSGFVDGPFALSLKKAKIELLSPALVVAIAPPRRLSHLTDPFIRDESIHTFALEPLTCCKEKPRQQRQRWRQQLFAAWLSGSHNQQIDWQDRSLINLPDRHHVQQAGADELRGLLIGLLDEQRIGQALGLLRTIDYHNRRLTILAPPEAQQAPTIQFGRLRLEPDGTAIPGRPAFL